jgi:RecA/RadA recombinase
MKELYEDTLPLMLAPITQLGLRASLGLNGWPSNRIAMIYGPPGGGKSSLFFHVAGEYISNDDEVWLRETEHALDRIYMASYLPCELEGNALLLEGIIVWKKRTQSLINKNEKIKEDKEGKRKFLSPKQIEIMQRRIADLSVLEKALKDGVPLEETTVPGHIRRDLISNAIAEYKLRKVSIEHPTTLEEFETRTIKQLEEKEADPKRRFKRLLIGVDSLSYLLPKEDMEKETSSDGRSLMTAKYIHTLLPRLLGRISGQETSLAFIVQQTTHIKMNPYERTSAISGVQGKGGLGTKFGASFMIGVENASKTTNAEGDEVKTGIINIPKAKLRAGGDGPSKGGFYLQEAVDKSKMDFDEPFISSILTEEKFGIVRKRGRHYVPESLLTTHPAFETEIKAKLKPLPKKESEKDDDEEPETEAPAAGTDSPAGKKEEVLYYSGYPLEIINLLKVTPKFEDLVLEEYGVVSAV